MNAPDRSSDISRIFQSAPPRSPNLTEGERRDYLLNVLIPLLRATEMGDRWGHLVKTDRNPPFIPSDIIVWKDTMEHFDVITDPVGPAWQPRGIVDNTAWIWEDSATPPPNPLPSPPPPSTTPGGSGEVASLLELVKGLQQQVKVLTESSNSQYKSLVGILGLWNWPIYKGKIFGVGITLTPSQ